MPPTPTSGTCTAPNYARQNPLTPQWGKVTPFALGPPSQYQLTGPPKNANGSYSTVDIQKLIDFAANLDDTKKSKAEYWADGPASVFPPGHDFIFAQALSRKRGHSLDTDVKLFFMLGNAMMDASIASWYQKYKYDYVRPITAIRYHPSFKNKMVNSWLGPNKGFGMVEGSKWMPYQALHVVTPPFPEYVSGHSTFSGAGAYILATFSSSGDTFGAYVVVEGVVEVRAEHPGRRREAVVADVHARLLRGRRLAPVGWHPLQHRRHPRPLTGSAGRLEASAPRHRPTSRAPRARRSRVAP